MTPRPRHRSPSNGQRPQSGQPQPVDGQPATDAHREEDLPALSKDVIFNLLSVERRRLTLRYLRRNGPEASLSTLATRIAAHENAQPVDAVTSDQRKRVYIALYQSHLPKLDDAGVVDFDSRRGAVELAGNASLLYPYLDLEPTAEREPDSLPFRALVRGLRARVPSVTRHDAEGFDWPSA